MYAFIVSMLGPLPTGRAFGLRKSSAYEIASRNLHQYLQASVRPAGVIRKQAEAENRRDPRINWFGIHASSEGYSHRHLNNERGVAPMGQIRDVVRNVGQCPYCMHKALLFSSISWALTFSIFVIGFPLFLAISFAASCTLTLLWSAHLIVFILNACGELAEPNPAATDLSRRAIWPAVARAAAFAIFASASPRLAFAVTPCGGSDNEPCPTTCERRIIAGGTCTYCRSCCSRYDTVC